MNSPDIHRYERELGRAVKGLRRRKKVQDAFRKSLSMFLEEIETPTYHDLERAFGPPEQMAQELIDSLPELPKPLGLAQKIGLAVSLCMLVVVICIGNFCSRNMPETKTTVLSTETYMNNNDDVLSNYKLFSSTEFSQNDFSWIQEKGNSGYLLLVENTNQVDAMISVEYNHYQPLHTFIVPAGEQMIFQVDDALPTEHVISFDTPDGSMSGTVQVFLHLPV